MSIRNHAISGVITVSTLLNVSMGLIGALSLIVYNSATARIDKVEATQIAQQGEIQNVAYNVYLMCSSQKNVKCIKPDSPIK